jgi:hypothetical protein
MDSNRTHQRQRKVAEAGSGCTHQTATGTATTDAWSECTTQKKHK